MKQGGLPWMEVRRLKDDNDFFQRILSVKKRFDFQFGASTDQQSKFITFQHGRLARISFLVCSVA